MNYSALAHFIATPLYDNVIEQSFVDSLSLGKSCKTRFSLISTAPLLAYYFYNGFFSLTLHSFPTLPLSCPLRHPHCKVVFG